LFATKRPGKMKKNINRTSGIMIKNLHGRRTSVLLSLFLLLLMSKVSAEKLITYPAPVSYAKSPNYTVTVNGKTSPVYDARINDPDNCGFTYFDFEGTVHIVVTVPAGFESVKIRPLSAGIKPAIKGNRIEFDMTSPKKLCLELNGKLSYPLFIFANTLEVNPPKATDPNVRYFGPGFHDAGQIDIKSNETVYIAGGAVVKGYFTSTNTTNIKILGRGIMDAHENNTGMISFRDCKNIIMDGIFIIDQPTYRWTSTYTSCDSVLVRNIKIIAGDNVSNDGIDIVSSQKFTVDDCFVKCYDDCVVIKAMGTSRRDSRDILIKNCLIWNIQAYAVQIGPELLASEVTDVLVKNCDFIHPNHTEKDPGEIYYYYCGSIGIVNGDSCEVHNIRYEDIRIEDPTAKLISLKIMKTQWNKDRGFGRIHDIYFKDIRVIDGSPAPSEIISTGLDDFYNSTKVRPGQLIENVTFENLNILGRTIMNVQEGGFIIYPSSVNLKFIK